MITDTFKLNLNQKKINFDFLSCIVGKYGSITIQVQETFIHLSLNVHQKSEIDCFKVQVKEYQNKSNKRDYKLDESDLTARLIYKAIKPIVSYHLPINIDISILSNDNSVGVDILGILGCTLLLSIVKIPIEDVVASCRVIQNKSSNGFKIGTNLSDDDDESSINFLLAGNDNCFTLLECETREVRDNNIIQALEFGKRQLREIANKIRNFLNFQPFIKKSSKLDLVIQEMIEVFYKSDKIKLHSYDEIKRFVISTLHQVLKKQFIDVHFNLINLFENNIMSIENLIELLVNKIQKLSKLRFKESNITSMNISIANQAHGSSLITREHSTALSLVKLAPVNQMEELDMKKKQLQSKSRCLINIDLHDKTNLEMNIEYSNLINKAFKTVLPQNFSYTITLHQILSEDNFQDGIGATSLSLMDAGVPIKSHIGCVAATIIDNNSEEREIMLGSDLNHTVLYLTGTKNGITSMQVINDKTLDLLTLQKAILQTSKHLKNVVDTLYKKINKPKENLNSSVAIIKNIQVQPEYLGKLIGAQGRNIKELSFEHNVKFDVNRNGKIAICGEKFNVNNVIEAIKKIITIELVVQETSDNETIKEPQQDLNSIETIATMQSKSNERLKPVNGNENDSLKNKKNNNKQVIKSNVKKAPEPIIIDKKTFNF